MSINTFESLEAKNTWKDSLLKRFSSWATKHDVIEDPYVLNLIKDISEERNIHFWSHEDPAELLPSLEVKEGQGYIKFGKYLAIVRNLLVFLPVAVTWKAVSDATTGFAEFVSTNNATPVNFLEFWQNGYGYLDKFWTIGSIAEFDFWIIIFVITISLFSNIMQNSGQKIYDVVFNKEEKERISLAIEIKKYLFNAKPLESHNINQETLTSLDKLNQGIREYNKISQNIEKLSDDLTKVVPHIQNLQDKQIQIGIANNLELEKNLSNFTTQITNNLEELHNFTQNLGNSISSISTLLNDSLTQSVSNMKNDIDDSNSIIKKSARSLEKELQDLVSQINITMSALKAKNENKDS